MTNTIDSKSNKTYANLITFQYGGVEANYAAYDSNITVGLITYTGVPEIELSNLTFTSFFDSNYIKMKFPINLAPIDQLVRSYPHAKITVLIDEINVDDVTSKRALFKGQLLNVSKNPNNKADIATLTVATAKNLLSIPLGIPATSTCAWNFCDSNCKLDMDTLKRNTSISGVSGFVLTVADTSLVGEYMHRGYVEKDGIRIAVRIANANVLTLIRQPPPEWVSGVAVTIYPGCDKTLATCRSRWGNEENICPLGIAMPSYNPILQET